MEARYLILARYAEFTGEGLLNILGGDLDKIVADDYPYVHPQVLAATRLVLDRGDAQSEHSLAGVIVEADTDEVVAQGVNAKLPEFQIPAGATFVGTGILLPFRAVIFPRPGVYVVQLLVDDVVLAKTRLRVAPTSYYQNLKSPPQLAPPQEEANAG